MELNVDVKVNKRFNDVTNSKLQEEEVTSSSASEFSSSDSGFHFFQLSDLQPSGESCHSNEGSPLPCVKVTSGDGEVVGCNNKIWREKVDKETLAIIEVCLLIQ